MKKIFYRTGCLLAATLLLYGCKDFFDPETPDTLHETEYISSSTELYSGYFGMANSVMKVLDQGMFLEGLRSEFLEPTYNAPQEFWDVYNYEDHKGGSLKGNWLADPKGYYAIILNANDYIKHAFEYNKANPGAVDDLSFRGLIGGALRFKVWAYIQLVKYWGEAVYIDDPLIKYQDISNFPTWDLDQILDKCIDLINTGVNGINGKIEFNWLEVLDPAATSMSNQAGQDRSRNKTCPPAVALLAEMYLWKGDYEAVKQNFIEMFNAFQRYDSNYAYNPYNLDPDYRNEKWRRLFYQYVQREHLAGQRYYYEYQQTNRLLPYFSKRYAGVKWKDSEGNEYPTGYYLKPTVHVMNKFVEQEGRWGQNGSDINPIGGTMRRGRGTTFDGMDTAEPWVKKFFGADSEAHVNDGEGWFKTVPYIGMYRAAGMQLYLVEALIAMGQFEAALIFLNGSTNADLSDIANPGNSPFRKYYDNVQWLDAPTNTVPNPYYQQYRKGSPLEGYPIQLYGVRYSNAEGYPNHGVRGRAQQQPLGWSVVDTPNADITVDQRYLDSLVAEEWVYEFSGEGHSLSAMIRIARRWPELRPVFAAQVAAKYRENDPVGAATIEALLATDIKNWFVKYPLGEN